MRALLEQLLAHTEVLEAEIAELRAENQALRDEIARLKGEKGRPQFKANQPPRAADDPVKKPKSGTRPKKAAKVPRSQRVKIDRVETVALDREGIPADFETGGYREGTVQNIRFESDNVRYRLERGYAASTGRFYEAQLPEALRGEGYGPELQAFVLMLSFELRVPEAKIVTLLNEQGIVISAGQGANLLTKKHLADFAAERQAILTAGLTTTDYQQIDDPGLQVAGVNHHLSVLTNPYFACFFIHRSKNAANMASLLELRRLDEPDVVLASAPDGASLDFERQTLREAVKILLADGATQFRTQTRYQALWWIHEERHYAKLWLSFPAHRQRLEALRTAIWDFYDRLKASAATPSPAEKEALWREFDARFDPSTPSIVLNDRIRLTRAKKEQLLLVLEFPEVPLDNNRAERDRREAVVKRKISTGPRTADGAQAWEVFFTLLTTCRKQGINFFAYLRDRISGALALPALADLVRAHAPTG